MHKLVGPNAVGSTGNSETITLSSTETAKIASSQYVNPVVIAPDGQSLTFNIATGLNYVTIDLISPSMGTVHATLLSGTTPLRYVTLIGGAGNAVIPILGQ